MPGPLEIARRSATNTVRAARRALARRVLPDAGLWVVVRLEPPLAELPGPSFVRDAPPSLLEVLDALDLAAQDPQVAGVLLELAGEPGGFACAASLRRAVVALRRAGVAVAVYAEQLDAPSLLVASAASAIFLPETGRVFLVGVRADTFHLRDLLARIDVRPEVIRIGSHKSAGEMFTRDRMSPEQREQLEAMVDDLFAELVSGIAEGRGLVPDAVRDLVDRGPYTARAAVEAGLVDACVYPDELDRRLAALPTTRTNGVVHRVGWRTWCALRGMAAQGEPLLQELPRLAYVAAVGNIHRGGGARGIGSDALAESLDALREDDRVRGVVLRIDSPGGDALASDLLWRAASRLRREKPVVASMGEVAASGGYYLASAADTVLAEAGTVTGSIGVIGGKLDLEGLYRRLGIGRDAVERGARAGLLSETRAFTEDERHALRDEMADLYATFVDRVAEGRGLPPASIDRVAQGRVWSGLRARANGLVDAIGGPLEALREARGLAGLRSGERVPVDLWPRRPRLPGLAVLRQLLS